MKFKGTTILLLLFVGLGGYVYFFEFRGKEDRAKQADAKKKAINVEAGDITEISLVFPDRTITGVKKAEKQWEITSPAGIEPDNEEWELLASNVPRVEREDTVTSNAADLTEFGLNAPTVRVVAKTKNGKTIDLQFGSENPRKIYHYAKFADSNEVFLSPSSWSRIFQKTLTDLRNKKVLDFEPDDIDGIVLADGKNETAFQKAGSDWMIRKPVETQGDGPEISTFLSSVRFARAAGFAEAPVDAKAAGLEPPAIRLSFHDSKTNFSHDLLIGKSPETDKYYAKDSGRPAIFIIEKDILEKAKRPLIDWRDKKIAQLDREKNDLIEIHRGTETLTLKKDGSDWKASDGQKLQWDKVSGILNSLEFDKAKDIIDAPRALPTYGLDKPRLEIVFKQGTSDMVRLSFGSDSKSPEGVYVKTSTLPSVKIVSKDVYDRFNVKLEELIESPPAKP